MPGKVNASVVQGAFHLRGVTADHTDFDAGLTAAEFETAFPAATTKYFDNADGQEFTEAPAGTYVNAQGDSVSLLSELPVAFGITGLTKAEYKTLVALSGSQQDICIYKTCGGLSSLGEGIVYRDRNIHVGAMKTVGGVSIVMITTSKKFEAVCTDTFNQRFDITAT